MLTTTYKPRLFFTLSYIIRRYPATCKVTKSILPQHQRLEDSFTLQQVGFTLSPNRCLVFITHHTRVPLRWHTTLTYWLCRRIQFLYFQKNNSTASHSHHINHFLFYYHSRCRVAGKYAAACDQIYN